MVSLACWNKCASRFKGKHSNTWLASERTHLSYARISMKVHICSWSTISNVIGMIFSFESIQYWSITKYININSHWFWNYSNNEWWTTNNDSFLITISLTPNLHPSFIAAALKVLGHQLHHKRWWRLKIPCFGRWTFLSLGLLFRGFWLIVSGRERNKKYAKTWKLLHFKDQRCFFCLLFPLFLAKKAKSEWLLGTFHQQISEMKMICFFWGGFPTKTDNMNNLDFFWPAQGSLELRKIDMAKNWGFDNVRCTSKLPRDGKFLLSSRCAAGKLPERRSKMDAASCCSCCQELYSWNSTNNTQWFHIKAATKKGTIIWLSKTLKPSRSGSPRISACWSVFEFPQL